MTMLKKSFAAAAALVVAGAASAQVGGSGSDTSLVNLSGVSAKVGIGIPFDSDVSSGIGSTLTMIGGEYALTKSFLRNSETFFAAEIYVRDYSGSRGYILPITVNQRFYNTNNATAFQRRTYGFVGLGFAVLDNNNVSGGTNTSLVLHGGVGAELGERIFAELGAYFGESKGGGRPNLISISAGYRF